MSDAKVQGTVHLVDETKTYGQKGFRKRMVVLEQNDLRIEECRGRDVGNAIAGEIFDDDLAKRLRLGLQVHRLAELVVAGVEVDGDRSVQVARRDVRRVGRDSNLDFGLRRAPRDGGVRACTWRVLSQGADVSRNDGM